VQSRGFHDWELYIIMEYCDQGSLAQMIAERAFWDTSKNQPDLRSILTVAHNVAAGMAYLHGKHILHGGERGGAWHDRG
jgi:serine/threonine protein kinase